MSLIERYNVEDLLLQIAKSYYFDEKIVKSFFGLISKRVYVCKQAFSYVKDLGGNKCRVGETMNECDIVKVMLTVEYPTWVKECYDHYDSTHSTNVSYDTFVHHVLEYIANNYGMNQLKDIRLWLHLCGPFGNPRIVRGYLGSVGTRTVNTRAFPLSETRPSYSKELPQSFICPICLDPFLNPVVASSGRTYCKQCIEQWLKNNNTDPVDRTIFITITLTPNISIWTMMNEYKTNDTVEQSEYRIKNDAKINDVVYAQTSPAMRRNGDD